MTFILSFINEIIHLWLEMSPYLLVGMVFSGLLHVFLGKDFIIRHLGQGGFPSIIKATLLGVPLPVCSCGVIPLATSLKKDGAHKSSVLSFLVSTPTTGIDSILATLALMGPLFAIFRPLAALLSGIMVGSLDYIFSGKFEQNKIIPSHEHQKTTLWFKLKEFFRHSFIEIPQDIGKWLVIGTILGAAISTFIPQEIFSQFVIFPLDFLIAFLVGIPLYICATGSIPVAVSLMAKGFSPGASLIFLIVGPATNTITLAFVRAKMGKKSFYLYIFSIIFIAVVLGLAFNYLWAALGKNTDLITGAGEHLTYPVKLVSAIILVGLIIAAFFKRKQCSLDFDWDISVNNIDCRHCKLTLEGKLRQVEGVDEVNVNVETKKVQVKGKVSKDVIVEKIKQAGYNPTQDKL